MKQASGHPGTRALFTQLAFDIESVRDRVGDPISPFNPHYARARRATPATGRQNKYPKKSDSESSLKPPLKWAGGKTWLVPKLRTMWEAHKNLRLVEPFCGGLAVTLGLQPAHALLNDVNPYLINFYNWVNRGLVLTGALENDEDLYYLRRDRFNDLIRAGDVSSHEAAEIFYFLNRTGFNGLCRFNQQGGFNTPFGKYAQINYQREFSSHTTVLSRYEIVSGDFESVSLCASDFVYADPPYDDVFTSYAKEGFSWDDQVRLALWLVSHKGPVAASNQATPRIVELYGDLGFDIEYLDAPRKISCNGNRQPAKEILATKGLR
jgi:DNA adenine methylase